MALEREFAQLQRGKNLSVTTDPWGRFYILEKQSFPATNKLLQVCVYVAYDAKEATEAYKDFRDAP